MKHKKGNERALCTLHMSEIPPPTFLRLCEANCCAPWLLAPIPLPPSPLCNSAGATMGRKGGKGHQGPGSSPGLSRLKMLLKAFSLSPHPTIAAIQSLFDVCSGLWNILARFNRLDDSEHPHHTCLHLGRGAAENAILWKLKFHHLPLYPWTHCPQGAYK